MSLIGESKFGEIFQICSFAVTTVTLFRVYFIMVPDRRPLLSESKVAVVAGEVVQG